MKIDIIAAGVMKKNNPLYDVWYDYAKRMSWKINLNQQTGSDSNQINTQILKSLIPGAYTITLDGNGKDFTSSSFAKQIENLQISGQSHFQFIIGPSDGLSKDIKNKADLSISFGKQTWPHMLVRIMLIEQLYRTQQILSGHPYHK